MTYPPFNQVSESIEYRLAQVFEVLRELEVAHNKCTAKQLYDYLTGETFSGEKNILREVIGNEYLLIHEALELSELIEQGVDIDNRTLMETPKEKICEAHLNAMSFELEYALLLEDYYWLKLRLGYHEKVVKEDSWLPDSHKEKAKKILDHYSQYLDQ